MGRRLTVAVPLHRSEQWVSSIAENARALPADAQVLLSDITHEDDALAQLKRVLEGDARITALRAAAPADVGWRTHFNHLLEHAETELLAWLPHDDRIAPGYFERLIAALDAMPSAALAYGPIVTIGGPYAEPHLHPGRPFPAGTELPEHEVVRLAREWNLGVPIHGVFRREWVRPLPPMPGDRFSDVVWGFGVGLSGHLVEVGDAVYTKRFHDNMTHTAWAPITTEQYVDGCAAQIRAGSPVRALAGDVEERLRAAFAGGPSQFPHWV